MSRSRTKAKRAIIVVVLVLAVPAAVYAVYAFTVGRNPFEGEQAHDFGIVAITGEQTTVVHDFDLTNRTDETIIVLKVVPSCGCAEADLSSYLIDPGKTVRLTISLTLTRSMLKEEAVGIIMKDRGARVVKVRAEGRRDPPISTAQATLVIDETGRAAFSYTVEFWDDGTPPQPALAGPRGLTLTTRGWEPVRGRDESRGEPQLWEGQAVAVLEEGATLAGDDAIAITLADGRSLALPVRRAPG